MQKKYSIISTDFTVSKESLGKWKKGSPFMIKSVSGNKMNLEMKDPMIGSPVAIIFVSIIVLAFLVGAYLAIIGGGNSKVGYTIIGVIIICALFTILQSLLKPIKK